MALPSAFLVCQDLTGDPSACGNCTNLGTVHGVNPEEARMKHPSKWLNKNKFVKGWRKQKNGQNTKELLIKNSLRIRKADFV